ncbi:MAG: AGE family epimerase/isomerase [Christensenellaceae bacterium]|nr:AGE family epimerase/isomerase [Christensenellaceae bacterium]
MINKEKLTELNNIYKTELLENTLPFWLEHSIDHQYGGYFSCLMRDGRVYDTDKFAWMLGRELWSLSKIYNEYGNDQRCLDGAKAGAVFLRKHAFTKEGDVYFSYKQNGEPLVHPYNIFSECFVCAGFAEYYRATGEEWSKELAIKLHERIQIRKKRPKGIWTKAVDDARAFSALNTIMIDFMLFIELKDIVPEYELMPILEENIHRFFKWHVDVPNNRILERAIPGGGYDFDHMEGRLLTPGHALETMWFLMKILHELGNTKLINTLAELMLHSINYGWDEQLGGIPVYKDALGLMGDKLEANQRHWWVHLESLSAMLLAYKLTRRQEFWEWFIRIHDYTFKHFPDEEYGEWYGYLDKYGNPEFTVKGSKFKTYYHLPRTLMCCERWLNDLYLSLPDTTV